MSNRTTYWLGVGFLTTMPLLVAILATTPLRSTETPAQAAPPKDQKECKQAAQIEPPALNGQEIQIINETSTIALLPPTNAVQQPGPTPEVPLFSKVPHGRIIITQQGGERSPKSPGLQPPQSPIQITSFDSAMSPWQLPEGEAGFVEEQSSVEAPPIESPTQPIVPYVPVHYENRNTNIALAVYQEGKTEKGGKDNKEEKGEKGEKGSDKGPQNTTPPDNQNQNQNQNPNPSTTSLSAFEGLIPKLGGGSAGLTTSQAPNESTTPSTSLGGGQNPVNGGLGAADLLSKSNNALGVEVQRRSPLVGDPRIEGLHFGQIYTQADGTYWFPARVDLDSVVSKLNSDNINSILIVKGPFSVRYGPGFSFLDIESLPTPRFKEGYFDAKGSTSLGYRTNGQGVQGQQSFWGGNADWGFRLTYDLQSANDYSTGNGTKLPSGYNNQFVNFSYGIDLTSKESLEIKYLHVQQNNVLLPGLLTNINNLTSDGFTARYTAKDGTWYDRFSLDTWINSTRFNGDSANPSLRAQIPQLDNIFPASIPANAPLAPFGPVRLDINTAGDALSYGAREMTTWGVDKGFNVSLGSDFRVFSNSYNEFDAFNLSVANGSVGNTPTPANLGIPYARQIDPGIFADTSIPVGDKVNIKVGARMDFVTNQFLDFGPNVDQATYNKLVPNAQGDKTFFLFSGFATGEYKLTPQWTFQNGYGYAQRASTLTELYTGGSFFGLIQNGFNSIYGNPNLEKEQMHQLNLSLKGKYETFRTGVNAFYAFMPDYITYNNLGPFTVNIQGAGVGTTPINQLQFVNTRLATLFGFDAYGEYDVTPMLTPFATLNFVEGWDQLRDQPLPGIPPLSSRVGLRIHPPGEKPRWGVEYFARMVATQDLFASSLGEQRTSGFVVHYLRGYWQPKDNFMILAGLENIGNLQYREHLDLRTGNGVFQPGINFYFGTKLTY